MLSKRTLASSGLVSAVLAATMITATPAHAACVNVAGVLIQTDLLGGACIAGGQTGPNTVEGIGIGAGTTVLGDRGIGLGIGAIVNGDRGTGIGDGVLVDGIDGIGIGAGTRVLGDNGLALGVGALVGGIDGISLGNGASANGFRGIAIGADALSLLEADLAIGRFARAGAPGDTIGSNTAFGDGAVATGGFASAFGANASAVGTNASSFGSGSSVTAPGGLAMGAGSLSTSAGSVAIGQGSVAGAADLTAGVYAPLTAGPVAGVAYDNTEGVNAGVASLGTVGDARQLVNVADGTRATDAVNLRQLSGVVDQANSALNAVGVRVDDIDARTTANTTSIASIDARTTTNETNITNIQGQLGNGTIGLVQQDQVTRTINVAGSTDGTAVDFAGAQGTRTLTGVSAGVGANDAVNATQLAAVVAKFGPDATINADGSITLPAYVVQGIQRTTVGDAVSALDGSVTGLRADVDAINRTGDGAYVAVEATGRPVAVAAAPGAIAVGGGSSATAPGSVAIGDGSSTTAAASVAIGSGSAAVRGPSVAYAAPGMTAPQTSFGEVSVGSAGSERQITNVAAGSAATDAVNVAQLQGSMAGTVRYDSLPSGAPNYSSVTLGAASSGPVALHNVAPGVLGTDAVNLDQLRATSFDLSREVGSYRTEAQRGTAVALAATGMRFDDRPGRTSMGGAVSYFRGEAGVALGVGHTSSSQRLRYNAAVSFSPNGGRNVGAVAGATFSFGD